MSLLLFSRVLSLFTLSLDSPAPIPTLPPTRRLLNPRQCRPTCMNRAEEEDENDNDEEEGVGTTTKEKKKAKVCIQETGLEREEARKRESQ